MISISSLKMATPKKSLKKFNKANQSKAIKKKQPFGNGIPTNDPSNVGSLKSRM